MQNPIPLTPSVAPIDAAPVDAAAAHAAINRLRATYKSAAEARDAATIAALYTEDAVLMPATGGRYVGRDEIEGSYAATFAMGAIGFDAEPRSLEVGRDLAVEEGAVTFSISPESGERQVLHVDYLVVAKQIDGELKIYRLLTKPAMDAPAA